MNRKLILRVLLWSLAVAAGAGVLAVLVGSYGVVGRVAATALTLGICSAVGWIMAWLGDRQRSHQAGLLGLAVTVVEFIATLVLIWMPGWSGHGWHWEWDLFASQWVVGGAAVVAMIFLVISAAPGARLAGRVGLTLTAIVTGCFLAAIWFDGGSYRLLDHLLETGAALAGLGLPLVGALVEPKAGWHARPWRYLGVVAAILAFAMAMIHIWGDPQGGEEWFVLVVSVALVIAHANMVLLCPLKTGQHWLAATTIAAAALCAVMVNALSVDLLPNAFAQRVSGASGIVAACGSLALLVLARLNHGGFVPQTDSHMLDIFLACPRCRKKQTLPLGDSTCAACGLRISIQIEQPRCVRCGYLLYMLTSDHCPECGLKVAAVGPTAS